MYYCDTIFDYLFDQAVEELERKANAKISKGEDYEEIDSDYIDDNGDHVFRGELRKRKDADTIHNTDSQLKDIQQADGVPSAEEYTADTVIFRSDLVKG